MHFIDTSALAAARFAARKPAKQTPNRKAAKAAAHRQAARVEDNPAALPTAAPVGKSGVMFIIAVAVVAFAMLVVPDGFAAGSEAAQATAPQTPTQALPIVPTNNRNAPPSDSELLTVTAAFVLMVLIAFGGAARRDLIWRLPLALLSFVAMVLVANATISLIALATYYFVFCYDDAKGK